MICSITYDVNGLNVICHLGQIKLDGEDIRVLSPMWLRNQIGVVSQVRYVLVQNVIYIISINKGGVKVNCY